MDHTGQPGVLPVPRRRRSKPKPKAQPSGLIGVLRTRLFGRGLAAVMTFITAVYVWQVWRMIEPSGQRLGSLELGMDLREVRKAMGGESGIETGSASLAFDRDGRVFTVHLGGPERRVTVLTCRETVTTAPACPALLGIRIGYERAEVLRNLGASERRRDGGRDILDYPQVGAAFGIENGRVAEVIVKPHSDHSAPWRMLLSRLVP